MRRHYPLDLDAGFLVAASAAVFAAVVGVFRGLSPGLVSKFSLGVLVGIFAIAGLIVGSVIAGRPDFGPNKRAALVRGFVATIPLYACGGLLFLPADKWFSLIPLLSVVAAALVGPPIGIFMYRLHRRVDPRDSDTDDSGQLAWLKGELLGSWIPLLISVALLAALGVGMRVVPEVDPTEIQPPHVPVTRVIPSLYRAVVEDSLDPTAHFELGEALTLIGRYEEALYHLSIAVAIDSLDADYWRALARAAFYGGEVNRPAEAYWNAVRLDPAALGRAGIDREVFKAVIAKAIGMDGPSN
jgi:tetratricopeptide (TPR) repeat protein